MTNDSICALFLRCNFEAIPSMLTRMNFHSAAISTIFKRYSSLLMLQSSPFNVNFANKTPKFIRFMKLVCIFGHYKEKMDLHASLHHREYCQYQEYLLKLSGDYQLSKCSIFKSSDFLKALQYTGSPNHLQILP